jgi:MFS family permease
MPEPDPHKSSRSISSEEQSARTPRKRGLIRRWQRLIRVLIHSPLGSYLAGRMSASMSAWMFRTTVGWVVWSSTQSPSMLGISVFLLLAPQMLLAPLSGVLADERDKRQLMGLTQLAGGLLKIITASLSLSGYLSIPSLFALIVLVGSMGALSQAAAKTAVGKMVKSRDLPMAISLNSVIFNVSGTVGPAVAGLVIAQFNPGISFLLAGLLSFLFVLLLRFAPPMPATVQAGRFWSQFKLGLRYVMQEPVLKWLLVLHIASATLARPFLEFVPALVTTLFAGGAQKAALVVSAVGIGSVIGGLWLAQRDSGHNRRAIALRLLHTVLGAMLLLSVCMVAFVWIPWYGLAVLLAFVAGFGMITRATGIQTLVQTLSEEGMRGRTVAIYSMILNGGAIAGSLFIGFLAETTGLRWSLTISVSAALLVWLLVRRPLTKAVDQLS